MTPKQISSAKRMLAKLQKIESMLTATQTAGCAMLEGVNRAALASNRDCQKTITMWLDMIRKNAA